MSTEWVGTRKSFRPFVVSRGCPRGRHYVARRVSPMFDFDEFMIALPSTVIIGGISALVSWLVIRGAVLSALRTYRREQMEGHSEQL